MNDAYVLGFMDKCASRGVDAEALLKFAYDDVKLGPWEDLPGGGRVRLPVKPAPKPVSKPIPKPVVKPEVKPTLEPEVKPEVSPEVETKTPPVASTGANPKLSDEEFHRQMMESMSGQRMNEEKRKRIAAQQKLGI